MRLNSPGTALVMKRAALGPAAMALRAARLKDGGLFAANPSGSLLTRGGHAGYMKNPQSAGLGALGVTGRQAAGTAASAAVAPAAATAGSSAATLIGAGAVAGPIGLVVGAVAALLVGKLFNKQYLDVNHANADIDAFTAAFNKYRTIAGSIPGRQFGLDTMEALFKGAVYSGVFPLNNRRLCFHNGCFKAPGDPGWVSGAIHGGPGTGTFTLPYAFQQMQKAGAFASSPVGASGAPAAGPVPVMRIGPVMRSGPTGRVAGFGCVRGGLGMIGGQAEAVVLTDQYWIPNNRADNPAWLVPTSDIAHQLLYDVADAWLATQPLVTTPYVAMAQAAPAPPSLAPPVSAPPAGSPSAAGPGTTPVGTGAGGGGGMIFPGAPVPLPAVLPPPGSPTPATGAGFATAGLSNLPGWSWILVAVSVMFALARPAHQPRSRRRHS
jgi:hypothetical protein